MTQGRAAALAECVIETGYTSLVLDRLAKQACQITNAEESSLLVRDPAAAGKAIVVAGCGSDDVGSRLDAVDGLSGRVLVSGEAMASPESAAAAVSWGGDIRGVLEASTHDPLRRFGPREASLLADLAEIAAAALRHAERRAQLHSSVRPLMAALATAIDERDVYTAGHSEAVADTSCALGQRLGLGPLDLLELESAALLHDLGKLAIPEEVITKPGPLTEKEAALVRGHPRLGAELLATVTGMEPAATIVRFHHERWDGSGYPDGLRHREIPLASRIIAACDAYDAMTSDRPYRRALPPETALERLRAGSGSQFDPDVVECLTEAIYGAPAGQHTSFHAKETTTRGPQ